MNTRGRKPRSNSPAAIAKREKYAADKAAKLAQQEVPLDNPDAPIAPDELKVEVTPNETPKLSLKDRLFGGTAPAGAPTKAKTVKKGQRGKQIDANLLAQTFPTIVAATVANYAQRLIKDPYKPCAPTQQEVYGTIGPLFSILSRRIEIVGTASEDIIDIITASLSALVAGIRIHITYLSIAEMVEKAKQNGHNGTTGTNTARSNGHASNQSTETRFSASGENPIPIGPIADESTNVRDGYTDLIGGDNVATKPEIELFAELSKRDRNGRVKLGLLSG